MTKTVSGQDPKKGQLELPRTAEDAKILGYTGDACEGCQQFTIKVEKNNTHSFMRCRLCDHRWNPQPLEPASTAV